MKWAVSLVLLSAVGLVVAAYAFMPPIPDMKGPDKDAIAQLPRSSYTVPGMPGVSVSYLHAGDPAGRRVIFVHGTPGDAADWGEYLLHVPAGFEYIAIDRPGFGESKPTNSMPSLEKQAAAIEPLLVERDGQWPVLVGHSLGGPVVVQTAADYPGKVGGLLVLAGALDPGQEHVQTIQWIGNWPVVRWLLPRPLRDANQELIPLKGQLQQLEPKLAGIRCPIEILHGTKDHLVPYANVAFMQAHFRSNPDVHVMTIPNQDHFLPWTNEKEVKEGLNSVLQMMANEPAGAKPQP